MLGDEDRGGGNAGHRAFRAAAGDGRYQSSDSTGIGEGVVSRMAEVEAAPVFLADGGEMGALLRTRDWATHPLGPPHAWPQPLKTLAGVMLGSAQPMFIAWGSDRAMLYNDSYAPLLGARHPRALGARFDEVWHDILGSIGPIMDRAFAGEPTHMDDIAIVMHRHGYPEQTHFAFSYTPVRGEDGGVAGVFCACKETTGEVLAERRLREGEARLRGVLDGMGDAFVLLDHDFRVLDINAEGLRLERRPASEIIGRTHWEVWPGSEDAELGRLYKRAMADRVPIGLEHRYAWADGHAAWIEMRAYPHRDRLAIFYRDVTEKKAAEAALRESEERFRFVLETVGGVGTWDWDIAADRVYADARFAALYGVDPKLVDAGAPISAFVAGVHPDDRERVGREIESAVAAAGEFASEYRTVGLGGGAFWVFARGRCFHDAEGRPSRFPGITVDISQRKAAEQALRESEARFRNMADHAPVMMWVTDAAGRCTYLNRVWHEFTGQSEDDARGFGWLDATHPDDRAEAGRVFLDANARCEPFRIEYRLRRSDGTYRWAIDAASPRFGRDREFLGYIGSVIDIDERREAEERLRESEAGTRLAFEGARLGTWDLRPPTGGLVWDARCKELFGLPPDAAVTYATFLEGCHPDDRARMEAAVSAATDPACAARFAEEFRAVGIEDRAERWLATRGRATFENGMCMRFTGVVLDVTEQKRAEAELRQLAGTLERRVQEEVAERAKAEEALRQAQKMEAVGQLTGGIAHDFNNLLTIVIGNTDMARRALAGGEAARAGRALDNAQKGAERAAALTQRLLAFSRRQPLAPKPLDVDKLVAGMSDLLNRTLGETVRLEVVTSPGLWRVEVDPNQLENALLNLAVNARDAMPDGGKLTVETANARLDEGYSAANAEVTPGQYVVVAVTDIGVGMPKETLARVFEPFFTTKEVGKGTGLGLSQVYGFVKQSGGHVKVYSEPGQGTTVKLYLPRLMSEAGADAEEGGPAAPDTTRRQETVLVVEDDDDVRAYTVEILRELGYRVLEAHDGPAALRLLERQEPPVRLLFTDVVMPGMSGRELAERARAVRPDLKVLYTSGYTRTAVARNGRLEPGVEMIAKPFTYQALAAKIKDVLDAGHTGRVLVVEDDATVRMFAAEALASVGYAVDEAATRTEGLNRVRSAQGRYDAIVLDARLPEKAGDAVALELRAMHADLPILMASGEHEAELRERFAGDRCTGVIGKPYNAAKLQAALAELGVMCASKRRGGPAPCSDR